jgi:hypothetical protein
MKLNSNAKTTTPILEAGVEIWCNTNNNANSLWSSSLNSDKDGGILNESNINDSQMEQNDVDSIMCNNSNKENWSNQQKPGNNWYKNNAPNQQQQQQQQQYMNNNNQQNNKWNNNPDQLSNFNANKRTQQQSWSTNSNPDSPTKSQWYDQQPTKNDKFKQWSNNNSSSNTWMDPSQSGDMGNGPLQQPNVSSSPSSSSTTSVNTAATSHVQSLNSKIEPMGWDEPDITQSKKLDDGTNIWGDPQMYKQKKVQNWTNHTKHVPNQNVIKPSFDQDTLVQQQQQQQQYQSVLQPINTNTTTNTQWNRSQSQWNNTPAAPMSLNEPVQTVSLA